MTSSFPGLTGDPLTDHATGARPLAPGTTPVLTQTFRPLPQRHPGMTWGFPRVPGAVPKLPREGPRDIRVVGNRHGARLVGIPASPGRLATQDRLVARSVAVSRQSIWGDMPEANAAR